MCGIVGSFGSLAVREERVRQMLACITHRGPDAQGAWIDQGSGIALGHVRLSILDLSEAGAQPMISASGRYVIVFNGEIYNHLEIRKVLDRSGSPVSWRGHSDTETLLAAIECWGLQGALGRCVGMFALGLWDKECQTLALARDRFGEKPLYYTLQNGTFSFASELKALRALTGLGAKVDNDAVSLLLHDGYISAPYTIYKKVLKLLPGHTLTISRQDLDGTLLPGSVAYWDMETVAERAMKTPFLGSDDQAIRELTTRLTQAVEGQMLADVPLGAFLSGGVDSSLIVALMQSKSMLPVKTFSIGFSDPAYDESPYARDVARHLGTQHTEHIVTPEEALAMIPDLPAIYDEPFADVSAIPTCILSQITRAKVSVSLSGDAGDELFAGYNRYLGAAKTWRKLGSVPLLARGVFSSVVQAMPPERWDAIADRLNVFVPKNKRYQAVGNKLHRLAKSAKARNAQEFYELLTAKWPEPQSVLQHSASAAGLSQALLTQSQALSLETMMLADTLQYLPDDILVKVDRAAMAVGLETRVPMLDHRLVEFAWSLPMSMKVRDGSGKWILKQVLQQFVPASLIDRPKMGFDVPVDRWLRGPLRDWAEALLDPVVLKRQDVFNVGMVRSLWEAHASGKQSHHQQLWPILMYQAWHEKWMH